MADPVGLPGDADGAAVEAEHGLVESREATTSSPGLAPADEPVPAGSHKRPRVDKYFKAASQMEASDLHVKSGSPPRVRIRGAIKSLAGGPLSNRLIERLVFEIMTEAQKKRYEEHGAVDFAYHVIGGSRFRVNVYRQRGFTSVAARRISDDILDYDQLHLPKILSRIAEMHQGMTLVSGITGSGKTTTIASMLEQINLTRPCHIVTLEDPIEFVYHDKRAIVNQREVGVDVRNFHEALKYLMRQDPDVVLIGEMRDEETFSAALHAAESGHLVFGTVHANSTVGTITRVLELFPENSRDLVRSSLVFNLQAIVSLKLLKTVRADVPRVPACEICLVNSTVRKLLAEKRDRDIPAVIRSSYGEGMIDFNESLRVLVEAEFIDQATAFAASPNPDELKMRLKGINIAGSGIIG